MQLNVALQTEIVRFTVLGIQKAIRDVEESMLEQERNSTGGTSFFVSLIHADFQCATLIEYYVLPYLSTPVARARRSLSC